jgi:YD repeat-containing protein
LFRNYPSTIANFSWVLDNPTEECVFGGLPPAQLTQCRGAAGASFITLFDYDRQHNLLLGKRVLRGTSLGATDLLTKYTYGDISDPVNNLGSNGNVTAEAYEGGDDASLSTSSDFPYNTSSPPYRIFHTRGYTNGAPTSLSSRYDGFNFPTRDFTINAGTGLISKSRDASGLETSYAYDQLGRLVTVTPPGGSSTTYGFSDITNPVRIDATTRKTSDSTVLKQASYDYDGLGRLWHERTFVNSAWSTRTTRYDGMSRVTQRSQFLSTASTCAESGNTCSNTTYDALGRTKVFTSPDGLTTTFTYDVGSVQTTRKQQIAGTATADTIEKYDGLGRLQGVEDPVHTKGSYMYDAADHLIQAVVADNASHTQTRTFNYDNGGFLASETHPENGQVSYTYDGRGHVLTKSLAQSSIFDLQYNYDGAERPLYVFARIAAGQPAFRLMKQFTYASSEGTYHNAPDHSLGKLQVAVRHNFQTMGDVQVSETYHYGDPAGRLTDRTTAICLATDLSNLSNCTLKQSLTQTTSYNELGLIASTSYPGCDGLSGTPGCTIPTWGNVGRTYAEARVTNVVGIAQMTYSENEMLNTISHTNGTLDTIEKDDKNLARPKSILVTGPSPGATCTAPTWALQPASQRIQSNTTVTLNAAANGTNPTYQWSDGGTAIPNATSSTYTTPPLTTTHTYRVTAQNACGSITSSPATITIQTTCPAFQITSLTPDAKVSYNQSVRLSVGATGSQLTYAWFDGDGSRLTPVGSSSSSYTTGPLIRSTKFKVIVTDSCGATLTSAIITIVVSIPAPTNLRATATPATGRATLIWTLVPSQYTVGYYRIERRMLGGVWSEIDQVPTGTNTYQDIPLGSCASAAYRIRAKEIQYYTDSTFYGAYSNVDVATTCPFSSIPSAVSFIPIEETRQAINAARQVAGLSVMSWSDLVPGGPAPQVNAIVTASHITSLRIALDSALAALSIPVAPYSDPGLAPGTPIKLRHITELQGRTQ